MYPLYRSPASLQDLAPAREFTSRGICGSMSWAEGSAGAVGRSMSFQPRPLCLRTARDRRARLAVRTNLWAGGQGPCQPGVAIDCKTSDVAWYKACWGKLLAEASQLFGSTCRSCECSASSSPSASLAAGNCTLPRRNDYVDDDDDDDDDDDADADADADGDADDDADDDVDGDDDE